MKRLVELVLVYLIGVIFVVTLAFGVSKIDNESISSTSVAGNYNYSISNYD